MCVMPGFKSLIESVTVIVFTDEVGQQDGQQGGASNGCNSGTFPATILGGLLQFEGASGEGVSG